MVSIRRRRLLGLSSGGDSSLNALPDSGDANPNGSSLNALPDSGDANPNGSSLKALPVSGDANSNGSSLKALPVSGDANPNGSSLNALPVSGDANPNGSTLTPLPDSGYANPNGSLISTDPKTAFSTVEMKESVSIGSTQSSNGSDSSSSSIKQSDENSTEVGVKRKRMPVQKQETGMMKGVYFRCTKWQSAIKVDKKQIHLGTFTSQEEAAHLYDRAAFMLGRKPNSELSEEEKQELRKLNWEEFLAMTRTMVANKMYKSPVEGGLLLSSKSSLRNNDQESEQEGENIDVDSPAAEIAGGSNVVSSPVANEEEVVSPAVAAKEEVEAGGRNVVSLAAAKDEAVSPAEGTNIVSPLAKEEAVSPAAEED